MSHCQKEILVPVLEVKEVMMVAQMKGPVMEVADLV